MKPHDLVIANGELVDPSRGLRARGDVAIVGEKIAAVEDDLSGVPALQVIDASGWVVTPGLVDLHVHVFHGFSHYGVEADRTCLARGVTTAVDAGSAGAETFPGFRRWVIEVAQTRLFAFLNISAVGLVGVGVGELEELRYASAPRAVQMVEAHRDRILGIKVRLSRDVVGENGIAPLGLAREASDAVGLPLMIHVGDTPVPLPEILSVLRGGDILTHCFHGRAHGILDGRGRVLPEVGRAVEQGVLLDVGHGRGSFTFEVAERAMGQGLLPGTISSDLHAYNVHGPVFDLATTMSKFLSLGLSLEDVLRRTTTAPAAALGLGSQIGTLSAGAEADVVAFELREGCVRFEDCVGATRDGTVQLVPMLIVRGGRVVVPAPSGRVRTREPETVPVMHQPTSAEEGNR